MPRVCAWFITLSAAPWRRTGFARAGSFRQTWLAAQLELSGRYRGRSGPGRAAGKTAGLLRQLVRSETRRLRICQLTVRALTHSFQSIYEHDHEQRTR